MADEVEMIPVEPEAPPKADPFSKPTATKVSTIKLQPLARPPASPGAAKVPAPPIGERPPPAAGALKPGLKLPTQTALKPGVKLPPKPGAFKPGLKLPTQTALKPGVKLPPKQGAFKPGLKLPTQTALKPGVKLPPRPVIRKPGSATSAAPLPKPVAPAASASEPHPSAAPASPRPISVDAQGVGKLPTVESKSIARGDETPVVSTNPKPLEALKSVTQKLKGLTQEIPQQAILHKTGIIAEGVMTPAQKEAAKHKTARISLSDAMGVAPVRDESAPMKTIRIKRPVDINGVTSPGLSTHPDLKPIAPASSAVAPAAEAAEATPAGEGGDAKSAPPNVTQRKTLKIARPGGGMVKPSGKFGVKRPIGRGPAKPAAAGAAADGAKPPEGDVEDIPDIADIPAAPPVPVAVPKADDGPGWLWTLSALLQFAACVAMGALAWFLYENTQTAYF